MATKLYQASGGGPAAPGPEASPGGNGSGKTKGDVIDAEFEETS